MRNKWLFGIFFVILLIALLFAGIGSYMQTHSDPDQIDIFVGIDATFTIVENTIAY